MNAKSSKLILFQLVALLLFVTLPSLNAQDVELRTQADVDAFDPNTTVIFGKLLIGEQDELIADISDISNLSNLIEVKDELVISRCAFLENVDALSSLTTIGDYLSVTTNPILTNIDGLSNLTSMANRRDLIIYENPLLEDIDGLRNLEARVEILRIYNNASLRHLDGLVGLDRVSGTLEIEFNPKLENIDGLDNVKIARGVIDIVGNSSLEHINGFRGMFKMEADILIRGNTALKTINGFEALDDFDGSLNIFNNPKLQRIDGFTSLTDIQSSITISNNNALEHIDGLSNLSTVAGLVRINNNDRMQFINGLSGLSYVGGVLNIAGNKKLKYCCAIKDMVENKEMTIGDSLNIQANDYGCSSETQVLVNTCDIGFDISLTPACIDESNGSIQVFVELYDTLPIYYEWLRQEDGTMGNGESHSDQFTIDGLSAGTYNITLTTPNQDTSIRTDIMLVESEGSSFEIIEITTNNSSNSLDNGSIDIITAGGEAPYNYNWTGAESGSITGISGAQYTIPSLGYGEYSITVEDNSNSTATITVTLLDDDVEVITCEEPLDILILNDVSKSVDAVEYRSSQLFFVDLLQKLNIGNGDSDSRAAISEWSGSALLTIPITGDIETLNAYSLMSRSSKGNTLPLNALAYGADYLKGVGRADAEKVLVLATDGSGSQIPSSLIALADELKAEGFNIITVAFDDAYNDSDTREILRQVASVDLLAPGAPSYAELDENLAETIVGVYLCPIDPGDAATAYFERDGEIEIVSVDLDGDCNFFQSLDITIDISAYRELSIPSGTPITFYSGNPEMFGSTPILTWIIPCAIPAGETETFTITLPIERSTNIYAVLNDDGESATLQFPVTDIEEIAYSNNLDTTRICSDSIALLQVIKYTTTPQPVCDTMVSYTLNVCNTGQVNANNVTVTDIVPEGFVLLGSVFNGNGCAVQQDSTFDVDSECCFSLILNYSAAGAQQQFYNNQGVELSGPLQYDYIDFDGNSTTQEDVTIDGTIDCPSTVIEFSKSVNITETCDDSFVEFTFTINNELNVPLQGLTFTDILPEPCTWIFMPYAKNGLSVTSSELVGNEAIFTIDEVQPNTVATFQIDASLNTWDIDGMLNNTATIDNVPDLENGGFTTLISNTTSTEVTASPQIILIDTIVVDANTDTIDLIASLSSSADIAWTTSGDGTFINENTLTPMYVISDIDRELGEIILFISADSDCNETGSAVVVEIIECELEIEIIEIGECDVNGSPLDGSDDTYEVTFMITNSESYLGSEVLLTIDNIADTIDYNETYTIQLAADGQLDLLTFTDIGVGFCSATAEVLQELCTDECVLSFMSESLMVSDCDDNGTPRDSTDDFYVVDFIVNAHNPSDDNTYQVMYGDEEFVFTLDELVSLTLPADGIVDSILLSMEIDVDTCLLWLVNNQDNCYSDEPCLDLLTDIVIDQNIISDCEEDYEAILTASVSVVDSVELMFTWTDEDDNIVGEDPTLEVFDPGTYTISIDYCDQLDSNSVQLTVNTSPELFWPKVFFPEGTEELNRTFGPYTLCGNSVSDYTLKIYNRWGNEVFATTELMSEWDGTFKGQKSQAGVYVFVAEYSIDENAKKVQKAVKGDLTLLR